MKNQTSQISLHADLPIEVASKDPFKHDLLAFENPVVKVSTLISKMSTPFTIGVYGNWGSGKTSYMKLLSSQLAADGYETFWFNAWEYENESSLLLPLLAKLAEKIDAKSELFKSIKRIGAAVLMTGANIVTKTATINTTNISDLQKFFDLYEEQVGNSYEKWVSDIDELKGQFKELVNKICNNKSSLVLFIDDLDRCLPENVIKLIENIKHFLSINGSKCIFILGVDKSVISSAIKSKYGTDIISGDEYLEKFINLSIHVPHHNALTHKSYIQEVIRRQTSNEWYELIKNDIEIFSDKLSNTQFSNPRKTKILITRYLFFLSMGENKKYIPDIIILLIIYKEFFPEAYKMKEERNNVDYFPQTTRRSNQSPIGIPLTVKDFSNTNCSDFTFIYKNKNLRSLTCFEINLAWLVSNCFDKTVDKIKEALERDKFSGGPEGKDKEQVIDFLEGNYSIKNREYFHLVNFLFSLS